MTIVTHTFGAETIKYSEVNTNFTDITSAIDSLTTTNLHDAAGIVSTQLADRYALSPWSINVLPFMQTGVNATLSTNDDNALFTCDTGDVEVFRTTTRVQSSKKASIAFIEIFVVEKKIINSVNPQITIKLDDIVIGGAARTIDKDQYNDSGTTGGFHYIYNSNPIANPLINIDNNQTLKVFIGGNGQANKIRGVTVTFWIKEELCS
tara:strand:- start:82 stop:702 length:621 start_codon:yes stop_codon:yes gene_type:complete